MLASRASKREVENIIRLVCSVVFDGGEFPWHMKEADGCKRVLSDSGEEKTAGDGVTKDVVRSRSSSSVCAERCTKERFASSKEKDGD